MTGAKIRKEKIVIMAKHFEKIWCYLLQAVLLFDSQLIIKSDLLPFCIASGYNCGFKQVSLQINLVQHSSF